MFHLRRIAASTAALAAAALLFPAGAAADGKGHVETASKAPYGQYLVDGKGRSIYLFEKDQRGAASSTCYEACADAWPPVPAGEEPHAGGKALDTGKLGSFERKDGTSQLTYNGWPLYYFVKDSGPGDVQGQDVHGFGGEWYLVGPNGKAVEEQEHG